MTASLGTASAGTASAGIEIDLSGRGSLRGARAGGATQASLLNAAQGGAATGMLGAGSATGGRESFQARWQAMLAALGAGNAKDDEEDAADRSAATAAGTATAASSAAGGLRSGLAGVNQTSQDQAAQDHAGHDKTVQEAQPGLSLSQNVLSNAKRPAAAIAQNAALTAARVEEPSDQKLHATETAKGSSGRHSVEPERKRASESSATAMTAVTVAAAAHADAMGALIATPAVALGAAGASAVAEKAQRAGSSLNAFAQGSSEAFSSAAVAPEHGASRASGAAGKSGMTVASVGAKPDTVVPTAAQEGFADDAADAPGSGEAAVFYGGRVLSAQHLPGPSADVPAISGMTGSSENSDYRQPGISAPTDSQAANGVDPSLQSKQATALAAASHPSPQVAPVKGRNANEAGASAVHAAAAPLSGAADASLLARNPAAVPGGAHALNQAPTSAEASPATGAHDTFTALDAEPAAGMPSWIHAGAQQAEAGFQDPALGWIGVRADLGAGGIHAAIVPGSDQAAQLLGGHLAGLSAHLAAEQIPVDSLRMAAQTGGASPGADHGGMPTGEQGAGQQGQGQTAGQSPQQGASFGTSGVAQSTAGTIAETGIQGSGAVQAGQRSAGQIRPSANGNYISVLA